MCRTVHPDDAAVGTRLLPGYRKRGSRRESELSETIEKRGVLLNHPYQRCPIARPERGQRHQLAPLLALGDGVDRPAMGTARRRAQGLAKTLDHRVVEGRVKIPGALVRLGRSEAEEIGGEALKQTVPPDRTICGHAPARCQEEFLACGPRHEAGFVQPGEHLACRRA